MKAYDASGEALTARDVLDDQELAEYNAAQRTQAGRHSFKSPHRPIFPALDEDGYDVDGYAWGARTYGRRA